MKKVEKIAEKIKYERHESLSLVTDGHLIEKEKRRRKRLKDRSRAYGNILCFSLDSILLSRE
jgi:hypothetical protein